MANEGTYYGIGLDVSKMQKDGQAVIEEFGNIDRAAASVGKGVDALSGKMRYNVQSLSDAYRQSRDNFDGTIDDLKAGIAKTKEYLNELKLQYRDTLAVANKSGNPGMRSALRQLRQEIALEEASLQGLEARYKSLSDITAPSFRTQMMAIVNQMKQLRLEGRQDTEEYRELEAQMRKMVTVERQFAIERQNAAKGAGAVISGTMSGLQGMMGMYAAASGILGSFTKDQEKLVAIQTKLQSSMSILMGMQQMANTLNNTSAFRVTIVTRATQLWHTWNLRTATGLLRLGASAQFARAAAIGLHSGLLLLGGAAVIAAIAVISKLTSEQKKAREEQKKWRDQVGQNVASQIAEYRRLQAEWQDCNGDLEKQKIVVDKNREAWEKLGFKVDDVTSYEKVAVDNSEVVVNALIARAKAAAYASLAETKYAKAIELRLAAENAGTKWWQNMLIGLAASGGAEGGGIDIDTQEAMRADFIEKNRQQMLDEAGKLEKEADDLIKNGISQENIASGLLKGLPTVVRNTTNGTAKTYEDALAEILKQTDNFKKQLTSAQREGVRDSFGAEIDIAKGRQDWESYFRAKRDLAKFNYEQEKADALSAYEETEKAVAEKRIEWQRNGWDTSALDEQLNTAKDLYDQTCENIEARFKTSSENIDAESAAVEAKRRMSMLDYLAEYGSLKEKELAITEQYDAKIAQANDEWEKKSLENQKGQALARLRQQYGEIYKTIAGDVAKMGVFTINKAIADCEEEIARLASDPEKVEQNAQAIDILRQAIERMKGALNDFSPTGILKMFFGADKDNEGASHSFSERLQEMKKAWDNMSTEDKWKNVGGWADKIGNSLGKAAEYMKQVADASGDSRLKEASEQLGAVAQNFAAAGGGAASGGWIGAIVGGASDMLSQTIQAISEAAVLEAQAEKNAEDWARALKNVGVAMDATVYESPFGERKIAKASEAMRSSFEATKRYAEEIEALNKKYSEQEIERLVYGGVTSAGINTFLNPLGWIGGKNTISNEFKAYEEAIQKGYDGLQRMLVKTKDRSGWANFWGAQDEYTALGDLYPELFKNGELVIENAKKLLETNNALDESQKEQIKNLIELKEKYDEAMKVVDDAISDTFGGIASDLSDVIWDCIVNGGENAWERFGEIGSEHITKLGKEFIQEMLVTEYLEPYREQMRNAYGLGSPQEIQSEMRNIVANIFGGMKDMFAVGSAVAEEWNAWAQANGFDLSENTEEARKAATKSALGASQESIDESNGRLATMQTHTFEMNENVREIRTQNTQLISQAAALLEHVQGIHSDTGEMKTTMSELKTIASNIKSSVGTIVDAGVKVR